MRETPTPLWVFAAVAVVSWVIGLSLETSTPLLAALGTSAIGLILLVFLLRGSRVIWVLFVLEGAINLLTAPFLTPPWWTILAGTFGLGCLLVPPSRRFVWRPRAPKPGKSADTLASPDAEPDPDSGGRPRGWHLDPSDPGRLRYWMGEELGWSQRSIRARKGPGA